MKLRGYVVMGNKSKLKLVDRKYKYDSRFRKRVDRFIKYNVDYFEGMYVDCDTPIIFTANELLNLIHKK